MFRTLGAVALLLIAASTSGQAAPRSTAAAAAAGTGSALTPETVDLSGTWVGVIVIPDKDTRTATSLQAVLTQDGTVLTGTVGSNPATQHALTKGRVDSTKFGTTLTFNLQGPRAMMEFQLRVSDGMLRGEARLPGEPGAAPVELHRVDSNVRAKAPNVSGTWIGTFGLDKTEHLVQVVFQQSGDTVTGTAGPHAYHQMPIAKGKVGTIEAGTPVSFQIEMAADNVVMQFELALTDTGLKGTVTVTHNGEQTSGPVELIPVK